MVAVVVLFQNELSAWKNFGAQNEVMIGLKTTARISRYL